MRADKFSINDRGVKNGRGIRGLIWSATVLALSLVSTDLIAANAEDSWRPTPVFYLSGISSYFRKDGIDESLAALAATGELRFGSDRQPWYSSLFAEHRHSLSGRYGNQTILGGLFRYDSSRWDFTSVLATRHSANSADHWFYMGRVRYRVLENHKLGVVASGALHAPGDNAVAFGYFGSISDSLSLNIIVDPGINKGPAFATQMELVWQIH